MVCQKALLWQIHNAGILSVEGVVGMDLIDRQTAITAIFDLCDEVDTDNPHVDAIEDVLENLPSASTELSNNSPKLDNKNGELISRHEAIRDIHLMDVCVMYDDMCSTEEAVEKAIIATKRNAIFGLERIPSAEPERKKGKWKIYTDERFDIDYYKCSECGYEPYRKMDVSNFCPNCGSYNGGEEE